MVLSAVMKYAAIEAVHCHKKEKSIFVSFDRGNNINSTRGKVVLEPIAFQTGLLQNHFQYTSNNIS